MGEIIGYLIRNKEWIFQGIGVVVLVGLCRFIFIKRAKPNHTQKVNSGKGSTIIQAGGDVTLKDKVNSNGGK